MACPPPALRSSPRCAPCQLDARTPAAFAPAPHEQLPSRRTQKARTPTQLPTMPEFSMTACSFPVGPNPSCFNYSPAAADVYSYSVIPPADILFHRMAHRGKRYGVSGPSRPVIFPRDQIRRLLHPRLRRTRVGWTLRPGDTALFQRRTRLLQIERLGVSRRIVDDGDRIGTAGVARRRIRRTGRGTIVDGVRALDAVERRGLCLSLHALD